MQARLLWCIIAIECFTIMVGCLARSANSKQSDLEATTKLCGAYLQYATITHKTVIDLDKLCWRASAATQPSVVAVQPALDCTIA